MQRQLNVSFPLALKSISKIMKKSVLIILWIHTPHHPDFDTDTKEQESESKHVDRH